MATTMVTTSSRAPCHTTTATAFQPSRPRRQLSSLQTVRAPRLLRGGSGPAVSLRAQKSDEQLESSCTHGLDVDGVWRRMGGVLVPLLAAALVGGMPIVEAVTAPNMAFAVEVDPNQDSYQEILQRIKEKRARGGIAAPSVAQKSEPEQQSTSSAAARLKEAAEKARQEREASAVQSVQKREESRRGREYPAPFIAQQEKAIVDKVAVASPQQQAGVPSITIKQKTHGFLPLFVSQFFLLLATSGVVAVLFVLPDTQRKETKDKFDDLLERATRVAEDAYTKAKPVAAQAWQKAQELGVVAKPYAEKAWEQTKPIAAKAVEASKPLLKEAQVKANELILQAQEKTK